VDFALVAVCDHLGAPEGAALSLFAAARCAGWLAHALEQIQDGGLIRPRARYTGPPPESAPDA
jgi:citrate synthase